MAFLHYFIHTNTVTNLKTRSFSLETLRSFPAPLPALWPLSSHLRPTLHLPTVARVLTYFPVAASRRDVIVVVIFIILVKVQERALNRVQVLPILVGTRAMERAPRSATRQMRPVPRCLRGINRDSVDRSAHNI